MDGHCTLKLFQYWDTGEPPDEVAGWIEGFRVTNPEMQHRLYDRDRASWFIGKQIGERERRAFDAIAIPSMQSDYFRACAMAAKGGVYLDVDTEAGRPLRTLFSRAPYGMILAWNGNFQLGLLMFRRPGDPLMRAWLDQITCNIEQRVEGNASQLTGPGAIDRVIRNSLPGSPVRTSVEKITPITWNEAGAWIGMPIPAYKSGPRHWENWRGSPYADVSSANSGR